MTKISAVTISELKNYANVYHSGDDTMFSAMLIAGKQFITSYTGLPLTRGTGVPVVNPVLMGSASITGTSISGYTITITFPDNSTATATVQGDNSWTVSVPVGKTLKKDDVILVTQTSPSGNVSPPTIISMDYTPIISPPCVDDFEDLTIALYVLVVEMYDNRTIVVDNNKLNFVIRTILDSHSKNFL